MSEFYKGIDVSEHNPNVNMTRVKESGINFVMIRAGFGRYKTQKDKCFETHYKNASAAGLNIGAYWYSYATTVKEAEIEANLFLEVIKGKKFSMPVALDIEDDCQAGLSKDTVGKIIIAFNTIIEKAGYFAMLYSYDNFLTQKVNTNIMKRYALWCANTVGSPSMSCGIHQYSFTGRYTKSSTSSVSKTTTAVKETLDSVGFKFKDSDNGVLALKKLLMLAKQKKLITATVDSTPIFGSGTLKAVNELLKKWGYNENGIAGSKFVSMLYDQLTK